MREPGIEPGSKPFSVFEKEGDLLGNLGFIRLGRLHTTDILFALNFIIVIKFINIVFW